MFKWKKEKSAPGIWGNKKQPLLGMERRIIHHNHGSLFQRRQKLVGKPELQKPADPATHTHIPDTNMYPYRFHPYRRSFPAVYLCSLPDTPLLFAGPAPGSRSSFFLVILCRRNAFRMPLSLHPNALVISDCYASGWAAIYAFSFSGSIFRKLLCRSFFSQSPVSFSCFSRFIVDLETLNT